MGSFFSGLKKGWNLGEDKLGPLGGLLGAVGGGAMGLFGGDLAEGALKGGIVGSGALGQGGPLSTGDKLGNMAAGLGAAQSFMDGDWEGGTKSLGGMKKPTAQMMPSMPQMPSILSQPVGTPRQVPGLDDIPTELWRRRHRGY